MIKNGSIVYDSYHDGIFLLIFQDFNGEIVVWLQGKGTKHMFGRGNQCYSRDKYDEYINEGSVEIICE